MRALHDLPLLITREAEDAAPLVAQLQRQGVMARAAPCLRFVDTTDQKEFLPYRGVDADLLVTSARAVARVRQLGPDPAWRVLALAPRTTAALAAAGVAVHHAATGGAAVLAAAARPQVPLLYPTSDRGGDEVRRVRPDVVIAVAYRTVCAERLPDDVVALLSSGAAFAAVFFSPSAVTCFRQLTTAVPTCSFFHGRTTAEALLAAGWRAEPWELTG